MWERLQKLNHETGAGFDFIESELILKRQGRARVYLTGCDNQTEIGKMRGSGWGDVIGDEAQLFPRYLKSWWWTHSFRPLWTSRERCG
jgi:hypothetical protein